LRRGFGSRNQALAALVPPGVRAPSPRRCHLTAGTGTAVPRPPPGRPVLPAPTRRNREPHHRPRHRPARRRPRSFTTHDGTAGVELRLAIDLPSRTGGESITRWVKVSAYGLLASRTAESVRKGVRVTVIAEDLLAEAWLSTDDAGRAAN